MYRQNPNLIYIDVQTLVIIIVVYDYLFYISFYSKPMVEEYQVIVRPVSGKS